MLRSYLALTLLLSGGTLDAADPEPLRVHLVSGSKEYRSEDSLRAWRKRIEHDFHVRCTASWGEDGGVDLPNLDALADADVLLLFARRMPLPDATMAKLRAHWQAGKPIVALRTASHAFDREFSPVFDREVLGNHYDGHYGDTPVEVRPAEGAAKHPLLAGVGAITSRKLYKAGELPAGTTVLQLGDNGEGVEPVTLITEHRGGRVFYTSLGVPADFKDEDFRRLLENALFWVAEKQRRDYAREAED